MTPEDRAELRRAAKVEGLGDEIAMIRVWLKKESLKEDADLELLSLGLDRLSRAIGVQHKTTPKETYMDWLEKWEASLRAVEEGIFPERKGQPPRMLGADGRWYEAPERDDEG